MCPSILMWISGVGNFESRVNDFLSVKKVSRAVIAALQPGLLSILHPRRLNV